MMTKFKSVSTAMPKLIGKNLASKIKLAGSAFVLCSALACSKNQHIEKQQTPVVTVQTIQKPTVTGFDAEAFIQEAKEVKAIYQEALVQAKNNAQRGVSSAEQVDALLQEGLSKRFGFDFSPLSARTTQEATLSPVYRVLVEEMQAELELLQTQAEMFSEEEAQEKSKAIVTAYNARIQAHPLILEDEKVKFYQATVTLDTMSDVFMELFSLDSADTAFRGFWSNVVKWFKKIVCWVVNIAVKVFVCVPVAGLAAGAVGSFTGSDSPLPGFVFNTVQQSCYWATNYVTTKICG
jgi:hypothetical protein